LHKLSRSISLEAFGDIGQDGNTGISDLAAQPQVFKNEPRFEIL
jgi:hypothetical protein